MLSRAAPFLGRIQSSFTSSGVAWNKNHGAATIIPTRNECLPCTAHPTLRRRSLTPHSRHASRQLVRPIAALAPAVLAAAPAERAPPSPSKLRWEVALSHHDCATCEAEVAQLLAADPTNIEAAGAGGNRPLHLAAARARRGLPAAGAIRLLLAAGARPDARNASGQSSLHMLVCEPLSGATLAALRALLRGGASPSLPGPDGLPPLHTAAGFADGSAAARVIRVLLDAGVDVNQAASADGGSTALHQAAVNGGLYWPPVASLGPGSSSSGGLLPHRPAGRPALRIKQSAGAAAVAALVAAGSDVSACNAAGLAPLHYCAAHARQPAAAAAVVAALVAAGADVDGPDAGGKLKLTPMHHALHNASPAGPAVLAALAKAGASVRPLLERLD